MNLKETLKLLYRWISTLPLHVTEKKSWLYDVAKETLLSRVFAINTVVSCIGKGLTPVKGIRLLCRMKLEQGSTRSGKPGKMRVHLENLEISWNFENFNKYHGKMT